jgi:hypothetical protein
LTVGVLTLVFVRLLIVSRYDANTVRAILASATPTQVLFGTLVNSMAGLLPVVAIGIPWMLRMKRGVVAGLTFAVVGLLTISAIQLGLHSWPWLAFVLSLSFAVLAGLATEWDIRRYSARSPGEGRGDRKPYGQDVAVAAVLVLALFIGSDQPWLPAEAIEVRGNETLVGYVLDKDDTDLVVLAQADRTVVRLDRSDVQAREICRLGHTILSSDYEGCPD